MKSADQPTVAVTVQRTKCVHLEGQGGGESQWALTEITPGRARLALVFSVIALRTTIDKLATSRGCQIWQCPRSAFGHII